MRTRKGFTLVELIIALVLSTFVLVGIVGVASQMLRYSFDTSKKGANSQWGLMSMDIMQQELQLASVLYCPGRAAGPSHLAYSAACAADKSAILAGCIDYTFTNAPGYPGPTDGVANNVVAFYYCKYGSAEGNVAATAPWLLHYRKSASGCPYSPPPVCGAGSFDVVAQDFYPEGSNGWYFQRRDDKNGVDVVYQVGIGTGAANAPQPTSVHVNTSMSLQRSYLNTND